jgi:predicted CoA-binding protein
MKKTLVLGASPKEDRYSNRAVKMLTDHGHPVIAVGLREGFIDETPIILASQVSATDIDTISLYVGPNNQPEYYDFLLNLSPKRILFNPGTENEELMDLARKRNIEVEEACTLVLLSTNAY